MDASSSKATSTRINSYKHHGKDLSELRRQRTQSNITLRKKQREEQIQVKRNLPADENMTDESDNDDKSNQTNDLNDLAIRARSEDPTVRFEAIHTVRKLLSMGHHPPIDEVIQMNFLSLFVRYLTFDQYPDLQFESAWALTNIASGDSQQTQAVADANALPYLLRLLQSPHDNVCEQAVWAIGNLIGDGPTLRDNAVDLGIIQPLLKFIQKDIPVTFLRNVTWVIVNLCRHKESPLSFHAVQEILPAIKYLLKYTDTAILIDSTWALAYLLDCGNAMIQIVLDSGVLPDIIKLLAHIEVRIVTPALRAIGNIVTGTDEQTQLVLNHGVLAYFPQLLRHPREKIKKEAVWFLSNITAGNKEQVQAVINAQLIPDVIHHLRNSELVIQKEAVWCISNLTLSGTKEQIQYIVSQHVVAPLCNLLQKQDAQMLQICLDALHNILKQTPDDDLETVIMEIEECGGLDKIEALQIHPNKDIYQQSYDIIDKFFPNDSDDDDMLSANLNTEFSFGNSNENSSDNNAQPFQF
ncbi:unnamed protein product [Adineta ricciae]|uniref:Importin subunit alpha n=1 Tax=Adineta ricciae TaxID=249248 RepID=A0A815G3I8_ADIRI|nr:unnamed protein product [Adineta ricciae]